MGYTGEQKRLYDLKWRKTRRQDWIDSQGGCCAVCGSEDRLEVDHVDPATKLMEPAAIWSRRQEVRDEELAKCQVLCYDHHREKTNSDLTLLAGPDVHGTNRTYNNGCRCDDCKAFKKIKNAKRFTPL